MSVLLTGGLGYIGSHTCVELLNNNYDVVVVDNLINSKIEVKDKIEQITGKKIKFYEIDVCDKLALTEIFECETIDSVIHFAGLKAVGESVRVPLNYYHNNIISTLNLLEVMQQYEVYNLVFSSSATVYGMADKLPISEEEQTGRTTNPYGRTKYFIEEILKDVYMSNKKFNIAILRYFNPVGAHASGLIGEDPNGIPNNLMPYITRVSVGKLEKLTIYGNDYNTPDGTGIRDYIHVCDLANGHVCALKKLETKPGIVIYNLGTGRGISVLEMVTTFNKVNGNLVPFVFGKRREGDIDECYADVKKANQELNWVATRTLEEVCLSAYLFEKSSLNK